MRALQGIAPGVLAEMIRRQPASKERTAFAWSIAVGPALARATTVDLRDGVLRVTAKDAQWAAELNRARPVVLERLRELLGASAVNSIEVQL